jgi:hypothetical protein
MDADWERLRTPEFWRWIFENEVSFEDERSFELALPCSAGRGLKAQIDEGISITLSDLGSGFELGWIDDAHFHPNCLRPAETLHLAGIQDAPAKQHLATLLLLPFSVIASDSDAEELVGAAQRAWAALGFDGQCPGLTIPEFRHEEVEWHLDANSRWCLRQPGSNLDVRPLYTLRVEENSDFPAWLSEIGR